MYPVIKKSDIKSWRLTKNRYAVSEKYPDQDLTSPAPNMYICASGLCRFGTDEIPENRMDGIVSLANTICVEILRGIREEEMTSVITPLAEGI